MSKINTLTLMTFKVTAQLKDENCARKLILGPNDSSC